VLLERKNPQEQINVYIGEEEYRKSTTSQKEEQELLANLRAFTCEQISDSANLLT